MDIRRFLALRDSDCSIAMASGSDAARNVSQLVLLDSNFASMTKVVKEGRRAINNISRSASMFLVKTIYSLLLSVIFIFTLSPYPFVPIQLSLISTITVGVPSFFLALEPNKERVKGEFLVGILRNAIPGALIVVLYVSCLLYTSRDSDGYYWFVGRSDDVIKCSGYRIGPFEVENALMMHPSVLECAVTAAPDPIRGQVVKATIVLNKGFSASDELKKEIQTHVKKVTAPYKYPRIVEFVSELPKTTSGKIRRVEIRNNDMGK